MGWQRGMNEMEDWRRIFLREGVEETELSGKLAGVHGRFLSNHHIHPPHRTPNKRPKQDRITKLRPPSRGSMVLKMDTLHHSALIMHRLT